MDKGAYISLLESLPEHGIKNLIITAGEDDDISPEDLLEIQDEADEILDEIRIARCEAKDDRFHEDLTDDELGLTQM